MKNQNNQRLKSILSAAIAAIFIFGAVSASAQTRTATGNYCGQSIDSAELSALSSAAR